MISDTDGVPCGRCGHTAIFLTFIHPLGETAGARIYECSKCSYQTWEEWRHETPKPSPQPVQLQQQQPQRPKPPDETS